MKEIRVLGERVPPPSATDVPSGANSICGLTGSHAVPGSCLEGKALMAGELNGYQFVRTQS